MVITFYCAGNESDQNINQFKCVFQNDIDRGVTLDCNIPIEESIRIEVYRWDKRGGVQVKLIAGLYE